MQEFRRFSQMEASRLGYRVNKRLPLLDVPDDVRTTSEAGRRMLTLYAVVSCSFGFPRQKAESWLVQEQLLDCLTYDEQLFLSNEMEGGERARVQWGIEALWALAWALKLHDNLDFSDSCSDDFIKLLPDIKHLEPSETYAERFELRETAEILAKADLAYCLHWAIRDSELEGKSTLGSVPARVVIERRRALDWLLSQEPWDEVTLDT